MATAILEVFKLLKEEVGEEKAEKIVKIIEESIKTIREEAKAQKPILKAEIREELRKELVTKEEFFGETGNLRQEIEIVRQEIEVVRQEIEVVRQELSGKINALDQKVESIRREMRILFYVLLAFMFLLNKETVEFAFKVLGLLK